MLRIIRAASIICVLLVMTFPVVAAPCKPVGPNERVEFDFRETPLRDVTRWISCARQLNIMFQSEKIARRHVTWISSRKVKGRSLKARFQAMLHQQGLYLRKAGGFFMIESGPRDR